MLTGRVLFSCNPSRRVTDCVGHPCRVLHFVLPVSVIQSTGFSCLCSVLEIQEKLHVALLSVSSSLECTFVREAGLDCKGTIGQTWGVFFVLFCFVFFSFLIINSLMETSDWLFGLQVVQLEELLTVRHSVFVVGNAGTGKSQVS